jgi:hypothetical protein
MFAAETGMLYEPSGTVSGEVTVSFVDTVAPGGILNVEFVKLPVQPLGTEVCRLKLEGKQPFVS